MSKITYKDSGVDIDRADQFVHKVKKLAGLTKRQGVISGIGGFAGLFSLSHTRLQNPVLVAATDGVGTKIKLALECDDVTGLGQDLVGMCVNDLICCGAEPLFFLDYYATGKLNPTQAESLVGGMANALKSINCALLGGETAEMPGLYQNHDFDLAGFAVGVVDENRIIEGSHVALGDCLIGMASSGPHSNGFSLIRKIIETCSLNLSENHSFAPQGLGKALLKPTQLYVNPILNLLKNYDLHAMAHITGGGLIENLPRVFSASCKAVVETKNIPVLELFRYLQKQGNIDEDEMWRVFNMGVGFVLIVKEEDAEHIIQDLNGMNYPAFLMGHITKRNDDQAKQVEFV